MAWLNPGRWLAALLVLLALYFLHLNVTHRAVTKAVEDTRAEYAQAALKQSEANRAKEKQLNLSVERLRTDYAKQKSLNAALARANADRLREYEAASGAAGADAFATSGTDATFAAIAGECGRALVSLDEHAQNLRATAAALQDYASTLHLKD